MNARISTLTSTRFSVSLFLCFFISLFLYASPVSATITPSALVIISQVRGEECCSKGSLANLELQLKTTTRLGLPATYAVRYDALTSDAYVRLLKTYKTTYPDLIDIGVMVEVVPSLAEAADISYRGTSESWYQAHHAFTIGYPKIARKKLLDTLFAQFKKSFGSYPRVSSAWMIDTDSANYIKDAYGIGFHQITREQWGTDSYTLYGGPPHYPYPASKNWLMVPDFATTDPLWIVRQTVTDPIYNYGDATSSYTSQPNDYERGGRTLEYFKKLLTQAFDTNLNPLGFACIGLENSMDISYQNEYVKQLEWVAQEYENTRLMPVPVDRVGLIFGSHSVTSYTGVHDEAQATWMTSSTYRIRIVRSRGELYISDIRVYSPKLTDPYNNTIAKHEGYWIVPFLIDGSRWHDTTDHTYRHIPHEFLPVYYDTVGGSSRLIIDTRAPQAYKAVQDAFDTVVIMLGDRSIRFDPLTTTFTGQAQELAYIPFTPLSFPVTKSRGAYTWIWGDVPLFSMNLRPEGAIQQMTFDLSHIEGWNEQRFVFYPYAYPESVSRALSTQYSRINATNRFAIAGRNPIRLIIEPHDDLNFPILLDEEAQIVTVPEGMQINRLGELRKSQHQYVDIVSQVPTKVDATVRFSQGGVDITRQFTVYFAPNCKNELKYCIIHPVEAGWYLITKISDWWNARR